MRRRARRPLIRVRSSSFSSTLLTPFRQPNTKTPAPLLPLFRRRLLLALAPLYPSVRRPQVRTRATRVSTLDGAERACGAFPGLRKLYDDLLLTPPCSSTPPVSSSSPSSGLKSPYNMALPVTQPISMPLVAFVLVTSRCVYIVSALHRDLGRRAFDCRY